MKIAPVNLKPDLMFQCFNKSTSLRSRFVRRSPIKIDRRDSKLRSIFTVQKETPAKLTWMISVDAEDTPLWKQKEGTYKNSFSTKRTWHLIRQAAPTVDWYKGIWFQHATPKYAFCTWLAQHNRLSTGDRMFAWNSSIDPACIFCQHGIETRNHLFFECAYAGAVWTKLTGGLLGSHFSTDWDSIAPLLVHDTLDCRVRVLVRVVFQTSIHSLWRERNERRHGSTPTPTASLVKFIDRQVKNKCLSISVTGNQRLGTLLQLWFASQA